MPETPVGRLAMRVEGEWWNAYFAKADTMEGALLLASIRMRFVDGNRERKDMFLDLMREAMADMLQEVFHHRPTWNEPEDAPESERSGHG